MLIKLVLFYFYKIFEHEGLLGNINEVKNFFLILFCQLYNKNHLFKKVKTMCKNNSAKLFTDCYY